jgi:hypothetical protein
MANYLNPTPAEQRQADIDELERIIADDAAFAELMADDAQVENVLDADHLAEIMESAILEHDKREEENNSAASPLASSLAKIQGKKKKPASKTKRKPAKKRKIVTYTSKLRIVEPETLGALRNWNGTLVEGNKSTHTIAIESFRSTNGGKPELCGRKMYSRTDVTRIINLDSDDTKLLKEVCTS